MILLDTNVISAVMLPAPIVEVRDWLDRHPASTLFLSVVSVAEIEFGLHNLPDGRRRRSLEQRFSFFLERGFVGRILPFDLPAARLYGQLRGERRRQGRPMSTLDAQIAAIARTRHLALATRNVRDFEGCGVEVVNPFEGAGGG